MRTHNVRLAPPAPAPGRGTSLRYFFCHSLPGSRRRRRRRERERYGVSASIRRGDPCFFRPNYCLRTPLCIKNDTSRTASDTKWCQADRKCVIADTPRASRTHACDRRTPRVRLADTQRAPRCSCACQADTLRAPRCSCACLEVTLRAWSSGARVAGSRARLGEGVAPVPEFPSSEPSGHFIFQRYPLFPLFKN